ncbi:protein kinase [Aggregicoccus sp. 17bor-14]|nr:protein kinase [Simulacricoccus sp. 17bor-14]MRI90554.1 protein kinase [Aggregicoccus sp. 17bor-14]
MAEVFLAVGVGAEGFEKPVAVKRILPNLAEDRGFVELFLREAKLTVALQHANVVQVFDLGALGGRYYMVLEFVDGENLRALQREAAQRGVALGVREACFIVQQVAEGLAYAHGRTDAAGQPLNVIHRDVNPSNVMVSAAGEVKLADFGIAKAANASSHTQAGMVKGKSGYVSPEQVLRGETDQRSDIFLLGLLLYELLAGRQLFGDPDYFQALRAISEFDVRTLAPLPGVPPALGQVLSRALAQDPGARYQRARELSDALRDFLFDHRLRVGPSELGELFARVFPERRSPLQLAASEGGEQIRLESGTPPRAGASRTTPAAAPPPPLAVRAAAAPPPAPGPRPAPAQGLPRPAAAAPRARGAAAHRRVGELLVASGKVTQAQLASALERQRRQGGRVGDMLVADGVVTEEDVVRVLSEQSGVPFVSDEKLRTMPVPTALLAALPMEQAERFEAVPIAQAGRELVLAMREPRNLGRLDELKFRTGASVRGVFATEGALRHAIGRFYRGEVPTPAWATRVAGPGSAAEPGVMPFSDRHTGTRERLLDEAALATAAQAAERPAQLQGRVLDAALGMLGGAAEQGPALARLARGVARRLGSGPVEAERAAAVAYAATFAARMEGSGRFTRPGADTLSALLGADAGEHAGLIAVCAPGAPAPAAAAGSAAQALYAALALLEAAGSARPPPAQATRALSALRASGALGPGALDALTAEMQEPVR